MRIVLPIVVLAASIAVAVFLMSNRPELARAPAQERSWVVEAVEVAYGELQPDLTVFGEVIAGREVEMRALVAGAVTALGEDFVEGGSVRKGELLVAIDPFDSQANLDERRAQLAEVRARAQEILASSQAESEALEHEIEQAEMIADDVARFEVLRERGTVSQKALDDARLALSRQREAVIVRRNAFDSWAAKLTQQNAIIDRFEVGVRRARRDLDRTRLLAPFDGFLSETSAAVGKRLSVNDRVARLVAAEALEVHVNLSDAQFGRLLDEGGLRGRPARVVWTVGPRSIAADAVIERTGARIDPASGGVPVYARLKGIDLQSPLRPGAFVEVRLKDRRYADVARLPDSALHGDTVYVVVGDRLAVRRVEVMAYHGEDIVVRGDLVDGDRVTITRFTEIADGVKVEVR